MEHLLPRVVIAAMKGGSGKTTLSLGLAAAWRGMGRRVVPFKKGPDYIDPGWLATAAGCPCRNLDLFFMEKTRLRDYFVRHAPRNGVAVVEGNRGLLDGLDIEGSASTAQIAMILDAPVVLILDCTMATRTVAAHAAGIRALEPGVRLEGVVLNRVAGKRHGSTIRASIERYLGIPVLGMVPRQAEELFPERHMGLTPHQEHPEVERAVGFAEGLVNEHLDLDTMWRLANDAAPLTGPEESLEKPKVAQETGPTIGVVRDSAFQFYYPDNIERLGAEGARVVFIDALKDTTLPRIDGLYIGGGFPETHVERLADNETLRKEINHAAREGLPIYAECGGLMYLGETLAVEGTEYPMAGALPVSFDIQRRPQGHGYTIVQVAGENPFFAPGQIFRGHEFHYSKVVSLDTSRASLAFLMERGRGIDGKKDGLVKGKALGTYTHIHAAALTNWARGVVGAVEGRPPEEASSGG